MLPWFEALFSRSRLQSLRQNLFPATEEVVLQNISCHLDGFHIQSKFLDAEALSLVSSAVIGRNHVYGSATLL